MLKSLEEINEGEERRRPNLLLGVLFFLTACSKTCPHRSVIWKQRGLHQEGRRSRENGPGMFGEGHAQQEGASGETVQLYGECLV